MNSKNMAPFFIIGEQGGKHYTFLKGTYDLYETDYFNEEGLHDGEYSSVHIGRSFPIIKAVAHHQPAS